MDIFEYRKKLEAAEDKAKELEAEIEQAKEELAKRIMTDEQLLGLHNDIRDGISMIVEVKHYHDIEEENKRLKVLLISAEPKWGVSNWLERELKKSQADFDKTWSEP